MDFFPGGCICHHHFLKYEFESLALLTVCSTVNKFACQKAENWANNLSTWHHRNCYSKQSMLSLCYTLMPRTLAFDERVSLKKQRLLNWQHHRAPVTVAVRSLGLTQPNVCLFHWYFSLFFFLWGFTKHRLSWNYRSCCLIPLWEQ